MRPCTSRATQRTGVTSTRSAPPATCPRAGAARTGPSRSWRVSTGPSSSSSSPISGRSTATTRPCTPSPCRAQIGGPQALADVVAYMASLPMTPDNGVGPGKDLELGKQLYADNCVRCHGENGEGDAEKFYPQAPGPALRVHPAPVPRDQGRRAQERQPGHGQAGARVHRAATAGGVRLLLPHQAAGRQDGPLGGLEEPGLQLIGTRPRALARPWSGTDQFAVFRLAMSALGVGSRGRPTVGAPPRRDRAKRSEPGAGPIAPSRRGAAPTAIPA